jgi:NADP-dependent 3-hydroxy acid dehydrogenase YdfG
MLTRLQETNVLGVHNTVVAWIRSQPDPKNPVGTVINVNSGLAGKVVPGNSAYSTSKLASHRYMEFVEAGEF